MNTITKIFDLLTEANTILRSNLSFLIKQVLLSFVIKVLAFISLIVIHFMVADFLPIFYLITFAISVFVMVHVVDAGLARVFLDISNPNQQTRTGIVNALLGLKMRILRISIIYALFAPVIFILAVLLIPAMTGIEASLRAQPDTPSLVNYLSLDVVFSLTIILLIPTIATIMFYFLLYIIVDRNLSIIRSIGLSFRLGRKHPLKIISFALISSFIGGLGHAFLMVGLVYTIPLVGIMTTMFYRHLADGELQRTVSAQ